MFPAAYHQVTFLRKAHRKGMRDHRALDPPLLLECSQNPLTSLSLAGRQSIGHLLKKAKFEGLCFTR